MGSLAHPWHPKSACDDRPVSIPDGSRYPIHGGCELSIVDEVVNVPSFDMYAVVFLPGRLADGLNN